MLRSQRSGLDVSDPLEKTDEELVFKSVHYCKELRSRLEGRLVCQHRSSAMTDTLFGVVGLCQNAMKTYPESLL